MESDQFSDFDLISEIIWIWFVINYTSVKANGEKIFTGVTAEGLPRKVKAQVCQVNKPLMSVNKLVKAGNKVVFEPQGAYIEDQGTGEKIQLTEQGGMYMVKLWVPAEGFWRPGLEESDLPQCL